mmetsp:Transcript_11054/g.37624  ORF Transcript_11054/g.37624 Transcript_11054/m.37624 type:complete len:220 (-) Transcript_11054:299-958(-)
MDGAHRQGLDPNLAQARAGPRAPQRAAPAGHPAHGPAPGGHASHAARVRAGPEALGRHLPGGRGAGDLPGAAGGRPGPGAAHPLRHALPAPRRGPAQRAHRAAGLGRGRSAQGRTHLRHAPLGRPGRAEEHGLLGHGRGEGRPAEPRRPQHLHGHRAVCGERHARLAARVDGPHLQPAVHDGHGGPVQEVQGGHEREEVTIAGDELGVGSEWPRLPGGA